MDRPPHTGATTGCNRQEILTATKQCDALTGSAGLHSLHMSEIGKESIFHFV